MGDIAVSDARDLRRYEARSGGELLGFLDYRRSPHAIVLVHTEVLPGAEGRRLVWLHKGRHGLMHGRVRIVSPRCGRETGGYVLRRSHSHALPPSRNLAIRDATA